MRCKNCGSENDADRYICENCGSPLYDESEPTKQVKLEGEKPVPNSPEQMRPPVNNEPPEEENKDAIKKNIIVISVLAVILVAIIISVIVVATSGSKKETTTSTSVTVSTTKKEDTSTTNQKPTTTEKETEDTTEETSEKESASQSESAPAPKKTYTISANTAVGGSVSGGGTYTEGDTVILTATPDDGYEFSGWYTNGSLVSTSSTYKFNASSNGSYSALFSPVDDSVPQGDGGND